MLVAGIDPANWFSVALFGVVWIMLASVIWVMWRVIRRLENPADDDIDVEQGL